MLKLSINSVTFKDETPVRRIELSKEAGFEAIEILGFPKEISPSSIKEIKNSLEKHDLKVSTIALGPPLGLSQGKLCIESEDNKIRERTLEHIKKCIDYAIELESEIVYVCTTRRKDEFADKEKALVRVKKFLTECADYASERGINIAIEHAPGTLIDKAAFLNEILKELNIRNIGALLDSGHLNMTREDLATTVSSTEKIFHVHLDNNDGKNDIHTPLDIGTLTKKDFLDFTKALKQSNYNGFYSIELLYLQEPVKTLKESINFIRTIYDSIGRFIRGVIL